MKKKKLNGILKNRLVKIKLKLKYIVLIFALLFFNDIRAYDIKIEIENCPEYYVFFGKHRGPDFIIIDSLPVKNNFVNFKSPEKLEHGIYFIAIPPQTRFDFIIDEVQDFNIKTNTRNILGDMKITGDQQYSIFVDMQKDIAEINKIRSQLEIQTEFYKNFQADTLSFIKRKIDSLNHFQQKIYKQYRNQTKPENFLNKVLAILEGIELTDSISALAYTNPQKHFDYYKKHWLDRVDFSEPGLLNTPAFVFHKLLEDYCFYFLETKVNNIEDAFQDVDILVNKTSNSLEFNQYVLSYLISRYENPKDLRLENLLVYIYRTYFLAKPPTWLEEHVFSVMKYRIEAIQYNLIGSVAKDLNLPDIDGNLHSVYEMPNKFKLLLFWEPDCDICNETAIILQSYYYKLREFDVEVYAVLIDSENEEWSDFIEENDLEWINVYDPKKETNFEKYYGTYKTPRIYLLDDENIIIAKDIKAESVYEYINKLTTKSQKTSSGFFHTF